MRLLVRAALPAAALLLAACGGNEQAAADSVATDPPGAPVGSYQNAADSAIAAGNRTLDSLKAAGQTPASGIDSAAVRAADTAGVRRP